MTAVSSTDTPTDTSAILRRPDRRTGSRLRTISRSVELHEVNPTRGPHSVASLR